MSDVVDALRRVETMAAATGGIRLIVSGPDQDKVSWIGVKADPGPTAYPPQMSLRPAGREVRLRVKFANGPETAERLQKELEILWGIAVPCGFTPWLRYPIVGRGDDVFHYLGPWQVLYDSLLGEGRGEAAWPSVCAAAQVDVGNWGGDRVVERFVQAQLHRVGVPCGVVDGVVGDRTISALRSLGLPRKGESFESIGSYLANVSPESRSNPQRRRGFISVDGEVAAFASGRVALTRNLQGYAIAIDGPGRIIVDISGDT